jgi:hypothetical protein
MTDGGALLGGAAKPEDAAEVASRRRLLLAQGMLERGEALCKTGDPLDRTLALLVLHCAVETAVRALAIKLEIAGVTRGRQIPLNELLGNIKGDPKFTALARSLYSPDLVAQLNDKRNAAQHSAEPVDAEILEECRATARSFLLRLFEDFFGMRLGELSQLDYIASPGLRRLLRVARGLATVGTPDAIEKAIAAVKLAFEIALESWFQPQIPRVPMGLPGGVSGAIETAARQIDTTIALLSTGVSPLDLRSVNAIGPMITRMRSRTIRQRGVWSGMSNDEDFRRVERFVMDAILKWQRQGRNPSASEADPALLAFEEDLAELSKPAAPPTS